MGTHLLCITVIGPSDITKQIETVHQQKRTTLSEIRKDNIYGYVYIGEEGANTNTGAEHAGDTGESNEEMLCKEARGGIFLIKREDFGTHDCWNAPVSVLCDS